MLVNDRVKLRILYHCLVTATLKNHWVKWVLKGNGESSGQAVRDPYSAVISIPSSTHPSSHTRIDLFLLGVLRFTHQDTADLDVATDGNKAKGTLTEGTKEVLRKVRMGARVGAIVLKICT